MIKVTEKKREAFAQLEIFTVEDLLKHYPLRYEIIDEKPFELWKKGEKLVFGGILISPAKVLRFGRNRSMTRFTVLYDEEEIECTIFRFLTVLGRICSLWINRLLYSAFIKEIINLPVRSSTLRQLSNKRESIRFMQEMKPLHKRNGKNISIEQSRWDYLK